MFVDIFVMYCVLFDGMSAASENSVFQNIESVQHYRKRRWQTEVRKK